MSIEKNMNTRIQHKHDTEANWNKAVNFIPKIGEIIVYDIDENYNYSRFKIGDGVRTINNLEFSQADLTGYATESYVNEGLATKQPVGDYALKSEIPTDYLTTIPSEYITDTELDAKGYLTSYTETDPTVPAWAKAPNKPTYTASEVGAASSTHKHPVTVTGTNAASVVTGNVTIPTVNRTQQYMTAVADAPVVTPSTDSVLGANTQFIVSGGAVSTTKLSAIASGVAVSASGTAKAITGFNDPATAAAITSLKTAVIKNPTVTTVTIPNVTKNDNVTASKVSTAAGQAASWSASVSNGVLSFDWVPNTPTEVSATDVSASKITLGDTLSASSVSTDDVTVATGAKSTVAAIIDLGTPTTATALTGVEVTSQPQVTIASGDTGDVTVANGVEAISVSASGDNVDVVTSVSVAAPAITLTNSDSSVDGAVPVVSAVEIGSATASIQNGSAAAQKWTQSTGTTGAIQ